MKLSYITDETKVPLKWVIALLGGASVFVGSAVGLGMYFGARDANAQGLSRRVDKLEAAVETISVVDRRLARIEGALHVTVPAEDRIPASSGF
jgi:hypothetical protein